MGGVNLRGANLTSAKIDENTIFIDPNDLDIMHHPNFEKIAVPILPDGAKWTSEIDMGRFTNPNHFAYQITLEKINIIRADMGLEPIETEDE